MGGECGTYGRLQECIKFSDGGDLRARHNLEDLSVEGRIILK